MVKRSAAFRKTLAQVDERKELMARPTQMAYNELEGEKKHVEDMLYDTLSAFKHSSTGYSFFMNARPLLKHWLRGQEKIRISAEQKALNTARLELAEAQAKLDALTAKMEPTPAQRETIPIGTKVIAEDTMNGGNFEATVHSFDVTRNKYPRDILYVVETKHGAVKSGLNRLQVQVAPVRRNKNPQALVSGPSWSSETNGNETVFTMDKRIVPEVGHLVQHGFGKNARVGEVLFITAGTLGKQPCDYLTIKLLQDGELKDDIPSTAVTVVGKVEPGRAKKPKGSQAARK